MATNDKQKTLAEILHEKARLESLGANKPTWVYQIYSKGFEAGVNEAKQRALVLVEALYSPSTNDPVKALATYRESVRV